MLTSEERATAWPEILDAQVAEDEERSGTRRTDWKVGGRASKANPNREDLAFWREEGLRQGEAYVKWLSDTGWRIATMPDGKPGIEWEATVWFGGKPCRLVIDAIYEVGDDWVIVDYKSGSKTPGSTLQLALYASALEQVVGRRPKWGAFLMTRKMELTPLTDLSAWGGAFIDYQFEAMEAAMETGYFPPVVGDHCEYRCSVRDYCIAVKGSKSADVPLHIPTKENR